MPELGYLGHENWIQYNPNTQCCNQKTKKLIGTYYQIMVTRVCSSRCKFPSSVKLTLSSSAVDEACCRYVLNLRPVVRAQVSPRSLRFCALCGTLVLVFVSLCCLTLGIYEYVLCALKFLFVICCLKVRNGKRWPSRQYRSAWSPISCR